MESLIIGLGLGFVSVDIVRNTVDAEAALDFLRCEGVVHWVFWIEDEVRVRVTDDG